MNNWSNFLQVNWTDGMKLNKELFIAQDNASFSNIYGLIASTLSPVRYGLLPVHDNYNIKISIDNQHIARVSINACKAITQGGFPINISAGTYAVGATDGVPATDLQITTGGNNTSYWIVLLAKPYERNPWGEIDPNENPARMPFVQAGYEVVIIQDHELGQYAQHPMALIVGKIIATGATVKADDEYIPPCIAVTASQDLLGLHTELDSFLAGLELSCSQIVQKIYKKSQQNNLSDLAKFVCDRLMLFLADAITDYRWGNVHESPAKMLSVIAGLARVLKNVIDLRIGSGKEELMNYLSEWCELNQGELESLLQTMATLRYKHNDINQNIQTIIGFVKVIGKLFNTLSNLEFIGKRKDAGLFVKEEPAHPDNDSNSSKPKRRFFG